MNKKKIKIKINGKAFSCLPGQTIMAVAKENGIFIPGLCGHPDFPVKANCRVCVVEIKGRRTLATSCSVLAEEGMEVLTDNERVARSRNLNIELIFAEHIEKCPTCTWNSNCALLDLARRYKINIKRFTDRKSKRETFRFANSVELDSSQCIDCRNCVDACTKLQKIDYLKIVGKGANQEIVPTDDHHKDCIYCGQCTLHCPVGSAQEQGHWPEVEKLLAEKKKVLVAQVAPSVRVALGEEFGMPYGQVVTEEMATALRQLGFDHVFDVNFSADVTTMVEAAELLERVANGGTMPMFTSCCPAWVKYVEFYHPELIPNLTTSRSPQIHGGGVVKTFWADRMGINPKDIVVVSIMPCTAKKFEASREEMRVDGNLPVDYVLTTRELAYLIKRKKIDFAKIKPSKMDSPMGEHSGAAVIYGGSGGVMESALRTAQCLASDGKGKLARSRVEFKEVRGLAGIKEATVDVAGTKVRIAVVNGIGNIAPVIEKLQDYDYIEVMACPGGCIGGGGEPIPTTPEIRRMRMEALYKLDKSKKIRKAHENQGVVEVLNWLKEQGHKTEHGILHTTYRDRTKKDAILPFFSWF
jgi:NADP-reducing hydrogenase subunit HndD